MLDSLRRLVQEVDHAHDLNAALKLIVERVKQEMRADVCSVYLTEQGTGDLVLMATNGLRQGAVERVRLKPNEGVVGLIASRAETISLEDAQTHPNFHFVASVGEAPYHGFLGVPMLRRSKILGVLVVQQKETRRFTSDEEAYLITLATQLGSVLSLAGAKSDIDGLNSSPEYKVIDSDTLIFSGGVGSRGVALGQAVVIYPETDLAGVPDQAITDVAEEMAHFKQAHADEIASIQALGARMDNILSAGDQALFDAYILLLKSPELTEGVTMRIAQYAWAPAALRDTIAEIADVFEEMDDDYLRGRAADIHDLGNRLLKRLLNKLGEISANSYPERTILLGEDISVSQLLDVPQSQLVGVVSERGTGASHVALLARGLGIPAIFGVENLPLAKLNGREVVVDGYAARVCIQPNARLREEYLRLLEEEVVLAANLRSLMHLPAETPDGRHITLLANTGILSDFTAADEAGAEGVGLYRSEIPFFLRDRFPTEEEQYALYRLALQSIHPKQVVMRTLDIGGDKPLSYFPIKEDNPFLGWRGIRISLDHPELFKTQVRAAIRASQDLNNLSLMLPMITTPSELIEAKRLISDVHRELVEDGHHLPYPAIGVMVEVPATVYQIRTISQQADFVSIGSNDLTQYLLAVDRTNERVAKLYDSLHPAVIEAIALIVAGAEAEGKPVSVCGEMAGDPISAVILMGLGIRILSMSRASLLPVKWAMRSVPYQVAQQLAQQARTAVSADQVRQAVAEALVTYKAGDLVRSTIRQVEG